MRGWATNPRHRVSFRYHLQLLLTEPDLIKACLLEDSAAQKELFERFGPRMLGVCQRYARHADDALDILQDAFIRVFDKLHQFKGEGSLEGWIRRIVVHAALRKYQRKHYQQERTSLDTLTDSQAPVLDGIDQQVSLKDLLALINNLPDGYRIVFNLYVMEGYSHEEIAQMLQIQPSTSRSQLLKARQLLQKQWLHREKISAA